MQDYRQTNPRLHALYVKWAMQHLHVANRFIEEMNGFSNWSAQRLAEPVRTIIGELVREEAAYQEAASRLFAGERPDWSDDEPEVAPVAPPQSTPAEEADPPETEAAPKAEEPSPSPRVIQVSSEQLLYFLMTGELPKPH